MYHDEFDSNFDFESGIDSKSEIEEDKSSAKASSMPDDSQSHTTSQTGTTKKSVQAEPARAIAPYIYTTSFNSSFDMLFCGGAGKNEYRIFDW